MQPYVSDVWAVVPILPALSTLFTLLLTALIAVAAALLKPGGFRRLLRLLWAQKLPLLVIAAVTVALLEGGSRLIGSRRPTDVTLPPTAEKWPMSRGSLRRTGASPAAKGPQRGGRNWSRAAQYRFFASPAVVDNRVYCVGSRNGRGRVFCWDQSSGQLLWSSSPAGFRESFSSAVVAGRYLVCGEGLHQTKNSRVLCLDVADGTLLWSFTTASHVECTPVIAGDRVYFSAGDDGIYCLRIDPELSDAERVIWHAEGARYPDAETALAVDDGRVYAGLGIGGNAVVILDADNGRELKRLEMPYPVFSPPAIAGRRLYVGMGHGDYVKPVDRPAGRIACIDLERQAVAWHFELPATVLGAVVADRDEIIFGCADGTLYVLDSTGKLVRRWDSGNPIVSSPCVTTESIYVANNSGRLTCLDRRWLQPLWEEQLGPAGRYFSSPVTDDGRILVGTENDGLISVGQPQRAIAVYWPGELGGPGRAGVGDESAVPASAEQLWEYSAKRTPKATSLGLPAVTAKEIVIPLKENAKCELICLDNRGSDPPTERWSRPMPNGVGHSAAIVGDSVVAVDGSRGDTARHLWCLNLNNGEIDWSLPVDAEASGVFLTDNNSIYIQDRVDRLTRLRLDNTVVWSIDLGRIDYAVHPAGGLIAVCLNEPPECVVLDRKTGMMLWRVPLDSPPTASAVIQEAHVYVPTADRIELRSLIDGRLIRHVKSSREVNALYVDPDRFCGITSESELIEGHTDRGVVMRRMIDCVAGVNPLSVANGILLQQGEQLMLYPVAEPTHARVWYEGLADDCVGRPMVMRDGRVYITSSGGSLFCLGRP